MRGVLLILAASLAASAWPAAAPAQRGGAEFSRHEARFSGQFARSPDVRVHRGRGDPRAFGDFRRDDDRHDRDFRGDTFLPYRDYQGDTLWRPDSFNDWWHDRPDRSFPRWLSTNQKCERLWSSGSGWRC